MHLRYAENSYLASKWSVWNLNEKPVSGSTAPLWLFILLFFKYLSISPYFFSKFVSFLALIGLCYELYKFYARKKATEEFIYDLLFIAVLFSLIPLIFYSISGMETILFLYLLISLINSTTTRSFWLFSVLIVLMRPEGCVFVFLASLLKLRGINQIVKHALPSFLAFSVYLIWHYSYFGYLFPNTFYAKADLPLIDGFIYGSNYIFSFVRDYGITIVFGLLFFLFKSKKDHIDKLILSIALFSTMYVLKVGGDNPNAFPHHRHFLPVITLFTIYAYLVLVEISKIFKHPKPALFFMLFLLTFPPYLNEADKIRTEKIKPLVKKGAEFSTKDILKLLFTADQSSIYSKNYDILSLMPNGIYVATPFAGKLPATFPYINFIDTLGLNDEHIAHHGARQFGLIDTKTDSKYVIEREPDFIEFTIEDTNYLLNNTAGRGVSHWRVIDEEMISNKKFRENYYLITTSAPALFIHKKAIHLLPRSMLSKITRMYPEHIQ